MHGNVVWTSTVVSHPSELCSGLIRRGQYRVKATNRQLYCFAAFRLQCMLLICPRAALGRFLSLSTMLLKLASAQPRLCAIPIVHVRTAYTNWRTTWWFLWHPQTFEARVQMPKPVNSRCIELDLMKILCRIRLSPCNVSSPPRVHNVTTSVAGGTVIRHPWCHRYRR